MADKAKTVVKPKFGKAQILTSSRFAHKKDLVNALLDDDKEYTLDEADTVINKYLKGKVM